LHNEYLDDLYFSQPLFGWSDQEGGDGNGVWHALGEEKYVYSLVNKPKEKRKLWRSKRKWESNIEMDLKEMVWEGVNRIELAQDV